MTNLEETYLNPRNPGSFGGVQRFHEQVQDGTTRGQAKRFLETLDEYTINKEHHKRFRRNPIIVTNLKQQYQVTMRTCEYRSSNDHKIS